MNMDEFENDGDDEVLPAALAGALQRIDRPQSPSDETEQRIRSAMLDRFDDGPTRALAVDNEADVDLVVEGQGSHASTTPSTRSITSLRDRRRTRWLDVARAAAVVVVLLLGALLANQYVLQGSEAPVVARPGPGQEEAETVLDATFCTEYVDPLTDALALWSPGGNASESRADVLEAVEVAIQAFIDLERAVELPLDSEWFALQEEAAAVRLAARGTDQVGADERHRELITHLGDELDRVSWIGDAATCAGDRLVIND